MRNPASRRFRLASFAAVAMSVAALAQAQQRQAPPSQAQPQTSQSLDPVAEAARRSAAEKDTPQPRKVYTEDDMSSLAGPVSVVGEDKPYLAYSDTNKPGAKPLPAGEARSGKKDEAYWRGRYQVLRQRIDALDKQIADKQEEIRKYGKRGASTDLPPTRRKLETCGTLNENPGDANTLHGCALAEFDRGSQLKDLEGEKAVLQNQMDQLQEEGRKAGAQPGWFR